MYEMHGVCIPYIKLKKKNKTLSYVNRDNSGYNRKTTELGKS